MSIEGVQTSRLDVGQAGVGEGEFDHERQDLPEQKNSIGVTSPPKEEEEETEEEKGNLVQSIWEDIFNTACDAVIRQDPEEVEEFFALERRGRASGTSAGLEGAAVLALWKPGLCPVSTEEKVARAALQGFEALYRAMWKLEEGKGLKADEVADCAIVFTVLAAASIMDVLLWRAEQTVIRHMVEADRLALQEERQQIAQAAKELETFQETATAAVRAIEEDIKQKAAESWQQIDAHRRHMEEENQRLANERERMDKERSFRAEVMAHEAECRKMEEQAWTALWEERRRHEKDTAELQAEVQRYRKDHERLSAEAAEARSSVLFKQQEMRRRYLCAEIQRVEATVRELDVKNKAAAADLGIEVPSSPLAMQPPSPRTPPTLDYRREDRICALAGRLVELETEGLCMMRDIERDRIERLRSPSIPPWIRSPCSAEPVRRPTTYTEQGRWWRRNTSPPRTRAPSSSRSPRRHSQELKVLEELKALKHRVSTLSGLVLRQEAATSSSPRRSSLTPLGSPLSQSRSLNNDGHVITTTASTVTMPLALARSLAAGSPSFSSLL